MIAKDAKFLHTDNEGTDRTAWMRSLISVFVGHIRQKECCSRCISKNGKESLRKHAYSNILRILPPKNEIFKMKNSGSFLISAQNIDCEYSLEPPR